MSRFSRIILIVAAVVGLAACARTAKVSGVLDGAPSADVVVKVLNVNHYQVLDTLKTDASGKFSCSVDVAKGQPEFVYIFHNDKKIASLLLEAGDRVSVKADTLGTSVVEGSEESLKLAAVEAEFAAAKALLAEISEKLQSASSSQASALRAQLSKAYVDYYRSRVSYIMNNSRSLTVVPVMYQSFSESLPVFGQSTDALHFCNAADTLEMVYPDSKYVKALRKEAQKRLNQMELFSRVAAAETVDFLEIELPDQNGKKVKLSDVHNKVTLVYFWTASDAAQKMFNLDALLPVYKKYHDNGFNIYHVSLDVDNGMWARVMQEQKLPWTNVSDISGGASRYALAYNLSSVPSAFVIGGNGLAGTTVKDAKSLEEAVAKALK
jgi:peroxiredoxin